MKTLITLTVFSVALAACGSSNTNLAGVNANGTCDSGLIEANNSLVRHGKQLNAYSTRDDANGFDRECQSFSAKYPASSCRAKDADTQKELTLNTRDIKAKCDHVHSILYPTAVAQAPAPVVTPTATPAIVKMTDVCSETFISSYNLMTLDIAAINDAGQNIGQAIVAARKFDQDCKSFMSTYPETVCKASDPTTRKIIELDSSSMAPTCKKVSDYLKSLSGGTSSNVLPDSGAVLQVIE